MRSMVSRAASYFCWNCFSREILSCNACCSAAFSAFACFLFHVSSISAISLRIFWRSFFFALFSSAFFSASCFLWSASSSAACCASACFCISFKAAFCLVSSLSSTSPTFCAVFLAYATAVSVPANASIMPFATVSAASTAICPLSSMPTAIPSPIYAPTSSFISLEGDAILNSPFSLESRVSFIFPATFAIFDRLLLMPLTIPSMICFPMFFNSLATSTPANLLLNLEKVFFAAVAMDSPAFFTPFATPSISCFPRFSHWNAMNAATIASMIFGILATSVGIACTRPTASLVMRYSAVSTSLGALSLITFAILMTICGTVSISCGRAAISPSPNARII